MRTYGIVNIYYMYVNKGLVVNMTQYIYVSDDEIHWQL